MIDWRDVRDHKLPILKLIRKGDGEPMALAKAGRQWYGCAWATFEQVGDLSCCSRFYDAEEVEAARRVVSTHAKWSGAYTTHSVNPAGLPACGSKAEIVYTGPENVENELNCRRCNQAQRKTE